MKKALLTAMREVWGLFVDDGSYAFLICVWVVLCLVVLPAFWVPVTVRPFVLIAGLIAILLENVVRSSRHERKK
ncbi:MAG: hypothetical protein JO308_16445 [Verrucomicrobia bacterium]|nr:hypothetical protein [Verrucomicrobiota bacterium]